MVSAAAFSLVIFTFLYQVGSRSVSYQSSAEAASRVPQDISLEAGATPYKEIPIYEVHIANNGSILLKDALVISILGDDIRVGMDWDFASFSWRVQTSPTSIGTKFIKPNNEKGEFSEIEVGNLITVTGRILEGGAEPVIDAQFIRL